MIEWRFRRNIRKFRSKVRRERLMRRGGRLLQACSAKAVAVAAACPNIYIIIWVSYCINKRQSNMLLLDYYSRLDDFGLVVEFRRLSLIINPFGLGV